MGKIGRFRYPDYGIDDAISSLEKIKRFVGRDIEGEISRETVAEALGMTIKSGTFLTKISSLSRWGLTEATKQGTIKLTDIAKNILYPVNDEERKQATSNVISNVEIWREIYEQFGETVTTEQLKRFLIEKGNAERSKAEKEADKILNIYIAAAPYLKHGTKIEEGVAEMKGKDEEGLKVPSEAKEIIEVKAGELIQRVPYTSEGIEVVKALINLLEIELKKKEKKETAIVG